MLVLSSWVLSEPSSAHRVVFVAPKRIVDPLNEKAEREVREPRIIQLARVEILVFDHAIDHQHQRYKTVRFSNATLEITELP